MPLRYPRPSALGQLGPGHNVVESSAGTGKTFLLEHLFVDLILSRGLSIEEILVVTFTEKATAELVLRLRKLLAELVDLEPDDPSALRAAGASAEHAWVIDAGAKQRLAQALLAFDRASISTIHGFCRRVLREHAFVQGRLFDEELVAEEAALRSAFRELLRASGSGAGSEGRALRVWLGSDRTVAELEKLLCECAGKNARDIRPRFDEAQLIDALHTWPTQIPNEAELTVQLKRAKVHSSTVKACVRRLAWLADVVPAHAGDPLGLLGARWDGSDLVDLLAYLQEKLPLSPDSELAHYTRAVSAIKAAAVPLEAAVVSTLLPRLRERAAADKRRAGRFDFADMLGLVGRALADDSPVREALQNALRARYRVALIDEFQDTDETQWQIFRRIFVDGHDGHALVVIGDPKQAIYGFRGADVHAYLEARRTLLSAGAGHVELTSNYRSTADLVAAQNFLFADEVGFFRPESGIRYQTPLGCGNPTRVLEASSSELAAPVVVFRLTTKEPSLRASNVHQAMQASIVEELRRLRGHERCLRLRGRPAGEAIRLRDVFVLTFTNRESRAIGQALGRAGIPFAFYKLGKLFESPEADEILQVLRAVAKPEDRGLCARAFLTRFFGLDLAKAAACIDSEGASLPSLRLHDWAALASKGDIPGLFASLLDDSGILRREIFLNSGERVLTNTMHVFEVLGAEWARTRASLSELVDRLAGYVRGSQTPAERESDLQRLETDQDAVQILTVYMAKGLEADVVFIYGGTGESTEQSNQVFHHQGVRVLQVGKPDPTAKQATSDEKADERARVLYVAITRARYRLYLPHYPAQLGRFSGPYRKANDHLVQLLGPELAKPNPLFSVRSIDCQMTPAPVASPSLAPAPGPVPPELLTMPAEPADLAAIRRERSGFLVTSYSAVKRARGQLVPRRDGDGGVGAELPHLHRVQGPDELPGGAKAGVFLHDILATVSLPELAGSPAWRDWFTRPAVAGLLHKLARRHGRRAIEIEPSARLVHLAYTREVRLGDVVVPGLAKAAPALREMEFHFPIPAAAHWLLSQRPASPSTPPWKIERGVVKGFVDLLFEYGGRVYVCDWKSDTLPAYTPEAVAPHCQEHYDIQSRIYTVATMRLCGIATREEHDRRFGGVFFCFLRGLGVDEGRSGIHFSRPDWDTVLAWERDMLGARFWGGAQ
jgi:exodeoxyribonuclease V beta subunit